MEPLEHIQRLIATKQITTAQWNLYCLAAKHLEEVGTGSASVMTCPPLIPRS